MPDWKRVTDGVYYRRILPRRVVIFRTVPSRFLLSDTSGRNAVFTGVLFGVDRCDRCEYVSVVHGGYVLSQWFSIGDAVSGGNILPSRKRNVE